MKSEGAPRSYPPRPPERKLGPDDYPHWLHQVARVDTHVIAPVPRIVLLAIGTYDWPTAGNGCTASEATLAKQLGLHRMTVCHAIQALCAMGLLEKRPGQGTSRNGRPTNRLVIDRKACAALGSDGLSDSTVAQVHGTEGSVPADSGKVEGLCHSVEGGSDAPDSQVSATPESQEVGALQVRTVKNEKHVSTHASGSLFPDTALVQDNPVGKIVRATQRVPKYPDATDEEDAAAERLRTYWLETCHRNEVHPSPRRYNLTIDRLRDGFTFEQLREVLFKASTDPWAQGANPSHSRTDDPLILFKSSETVEKWLAQPTAVSHAEIVREATRHPSLGVRRPGDPPRNLRIL